MRSLGALVVLDVVLIALGDVSKDLVGGMRVDEFGCIDLPPGTALLGWY